MLTEAYDPSFAEGIVDHLAIDADVVDKLRVAPHLESRCPHIRSLHALEIPLPIDLFFLFRTRTGDDLFEIEVFQSGDPAGVFYFLPFPIDPRGTVLDIIHSMNIIVLGLDEN